MAGQSFAATLRRLPNSLLYLVILFAILPLWSLTFVEMPWVTAAKAGWPHAALVVFTYWIAPWALAALLLLRNFLFLPLFFLEVVGFFYLVTFADQAGVSAVRTALLIVSSIGVAIVAHRDTIQPLLARSTRFWRKNPRIATNLNLTARVPGAADDARVKMVLEDISLSGLAAAVGADAARELEARLGDDRRLVVTVRRAGGDAVEVDCYVRWLRPVGEGFSRIGLAAVDIAEMPALIDLALPRNDDAPLRALTRKLWVSSAARRVLVTTWALSMAGSFGSPACGRVEKSDRRGAGGFVAEGGRMTSGRHGYDDNGVFPDMGFGLNGPARMRLAFTGKHLAFACGPEDRGHLSEFMPQARLLRQYSGGADFFKSFVRSHEESDPAGVTLPQTAAFPAFATRLGAGGMDSSVWVLNLVRFRPDHIKIAYELDRTRAGSAESIASASLIHAIAVKPEDTLEYYQDIMAMPTADELVGCALKGFLSKWIPRTSHFFTHSNIFDTAPGVDEWRFTEGKIAKVVTNASGAKSLVVRDRHASPAGAQTVDGELRIVPLTFSYFTWNGQGLTPAPNGASKTVWWSGDRSDPRNGIADLILPDAATGRPLPPRHLARNSDSTWSCASCHARAVGVITNAAQTELGDVLPMHFRHAAFGAEAPFGVPRPYARAELSPAFQQMLARTAEGLASQINGDADVACDGTEGYETLVASGVAGNCQTCHGAGNARQLLDLSQESRWLDLIDGITYYVASGAMPPGGSAATNAEAARVLRCWKAKVVAPDCPESFDFAAAQPHLARNCGGCHAAGGPNVDLLAEANWKSWKSVAHARLSARTMPPGGSAELHAMSEGDWATMETIARCSK